MVKISLGRFFLVDVVGFAKREFIVCKSRKESTDFEPCSEKLHPWALFVTDDSDLRDEYFLADFTFIIWAKKVRGNIVLSLTAKNY